MSQVYHGWAVYGILNSFLRSLMSDEESSLLRFGSLIQDFFNAELDMHDLQLRRQELEPSSRG